MLLFLLLLAIIVVRHLCWCFVCLVIDMAVVDAHAFFLLLLVSLAVEAVAAIAKCCRPSL